MTRRKNESTKQYIERWRQEYKKLTPVYSKLINGTINFSSQGFNHLVYEEGHRRPLGVIQDRLPYIPHITAVITNRPILLKPRLEVVEIYGRKREVLYHSFLNRVTTKEGHINVKVVVRKVGDKGEFIFQSVMKKRIYKDTKNTR